MHVAEAIEGCRCANMGRAVHHTLRQRCGSHAHCHTHAAMGALQGIPVYYRPGPGPEGFATSCGFGDGWRSPRTSLPPILHATRGAFNGTEK
eukprot:13730416-Alexandrium_andersonii.AAC.1